MEVIILIFVIQQKSTTKKLELYFAKIWHGDFISKNYSPLCSNFTDITHWCFFICRRYGVEKAFWFNWYYLLQVKHQENDDAEHVNSFLHGKYFIFL